MVQLIFLVIAAIVIAAIFVVLKVGHLRHRVLWVAILIAALILLAGFMISIYGKDIDLNTTEGVKTAGTLYMSWMVNSLNNVKSLTGQAVKMDWTDSNETLTKEQPKTTTQTIVRRGR